MDGGGNFFWLRAKKKSGLPVGQFFCAKGACVCAIVCEILTGMPTHDFIGHKKARRIYSTGYKCIC